MRKEWRDVTTKPEEIVRQKFIRTLVEHYGYALEQMDQERRTQHGHKSPRADIVIWHKGNSPDLVGRAAIWRGKIADPASINSKEIAALPVPDISVSRQQDLMEELDHQVGAAHAKRAEAATIRQSAWTAFESALFTAPEGIPS